MDLNHDSKTDLVQFYNGDGHSSPASLQLWISNGDGTFSKGQTVVAGVGAVAQQGATGIVTGDFDGDGKPDIALTYGFTYDSASAQDLVEPTTVEVLYGDGAGHLSPPTLSVDPNKYSDNNSIAADLNNDGRSDLISTPSEITDNGNGTTPLSLVSVFSGNSARTLTFFTIAINQCAGILEEGGVTVADFNGDGLNDLAYNESPCNQSSYVTDLAIKLGEGSDRFGAEQVVSQNLYQTGHAFAVRTTLGTKPDVVFSEYLGGSSGAIELLTNTSTGAFPSCGLSGFAEGVQMCAPGATSTSPVQFSVGTAGPTPMRTAAVWADGKKVAEQLTHAFSNYSFLDASVPLAAGSHNITVFGTGWDNTLQKKSFTLNVSSGASCSAPTTAGVHICQPASGGSVSSPVVIQATSTITGKLNSMQVWVDGVKQYSETSSTTLNTTLSVAAGSHRFAVLAINTTGTKWEQVVYATVK